MSSSETQKTPKSNVSQTFSCGKPHLNPKLRPVVDSDSLTTITPEKPHHFRHKTLPESTQKQPAAQIGSARRKIESWPEENPNQTEKLPEKYEILGELFDGLDAAIRLLRLKGLTPIFTNIYPKIACLTDRRFSYSHLGQLKYVLPEVIEIAKVLVKDVKTGGMKLDLRITMNVDAVEKDDELKSEGGGGHMHLRRAFRERLADISKSHPEGYEIPEETLPELYDCTKQDMHTDTKFPLVSSPKVLTDVHTVEQPEATCIQGDEIPDETHPVPCDQSNDDLNLNISGIPDLIVPTETSSEAPIEQKPAITTHLSPSFQRHSSQPSFRARNVSVPESNLSTVCSVKECSTAASSYGQVPATPMKEVGPIENEDGFPTKSASIQSTPAKLASTPARLMTLTPSLNPPKRCYMSPDDDSTSSPEKLVRRLPRSRSLIFDTPVKNKKVQDEVLDMDGVSIDEGFSDILAENLLQSLKDKEMKEIEEGNPAISQAKVEHQISGLAKLFNTIHYLYQSMNFSSITKEELVHKIIWTDLDVVDRKEVEEQLTLLLELVPEWISEKKLTSEGDLQLIYINKMSNPDSIRARLEAK